MKWTEGSSCSTACHYWMTRTCVIGAPVENTWPYAIEWGKCMFYYACGNYFLCVFVCCALCSSSCRITRTCVIGTPAENTWPYAIEWGKYMFLIIYEKYVMCVCVCRGSKRSIVYVSCMWPSAANVCFILLVEIDAHMWLELLWKICGCMR